jgi:hypothetical protein
MVGIRRRRFGSDDGVAVMGGASRRMRQYGILQHFSHNMVQYYNMFGRGYPRRIGRIQSYHAVGGANGTTMMVMFVG